MLNGAGLDQQIDALLAKPESSQEPTEQPADEADATDTLDQPELEQPTEDLELDPEPESEQEELHEDNSEQEEEGEEEGFYLEDDLDKTFIQVGDVELSIEDLKKGHMMQADYTKKTQALAEQRKQVDEKLKQVDQILEQVTLQADPLVSRYQEIQNQKLELDADDALQDDLDQELKVIERQYHQQQVKYQELAKLKQERIAEAQAEMVQQFMQETDMDQQGFGDFLQDVKKVSEEVGMSLDLINHTTDKGLLLLLHKVIQANRSDAVRAGLIDKKVRRQPKVIKKSSKAPPPKKASPSEMKAKLRAEYQQATTQAQKDDILNKIAGL